MTGLPVLSEPVGEELDLARRLAREAGDLQLARWNDLVVRGHKAHLNDLVSDVDVASEKLLVAGLRSVFPDDGVLGEEGTDIAGRSGRRWVLDPIDGTRNYITRSGPWSVCLALEEGRPHETAVTTVAVVHDPTVGETFSAARGQGAWLNGRPVCGSDVTALDQALLALTFNPSPRTRRRIGALLPSLLAAVGDIRRYPAALQLAYLAAVRVDVGLLMDTKPWDVAAGHLMAAEAGVQLSGPGGAPTPALTLSAAPGVRDEFERMICKLLSGAEIG